MDGKNTNITHIVTRLTSSFLYLNPIPLQCRLLADNSHSTPQSIGPMIRWFKWAKGNINQALDVLD